MSENEADNREWGYSFDGESYSGPFPTREAALADARESRKGDIELGETVEVTLCRCDNVTFFEALDHAIDAGDIIERAEESACEDHGNEDSVFTQGRAAELELERRLRATAAEWLREFPCRKWFDAVCQEDVTLEPVR